MKQDLHEKRDNYFRSYLYDGALLVGPYGFPQLQKSTSIPFNPLSFVECRTKRRKDNRWLHFYAEDLNFECVWNSPKSYVKLLKSFAGVITPDFSMYGDLPRSFQIWNCFRNRALAFWFQRRLNLDIIPSVSWVGADSYSWCFDGLPEGGTVSVSGNGCYFNPYSRQRFIDGFNAMKERLHPDVIVGVGYIPKELRKTSNLIILPGYSQQRTARNG